jgi:protein-S-isoprenylcysteine O-methyltransferase Ste14
MASNALLAADGTAEGAPSLWCGCVDCNDVAAIFRGNSGNRTFWKALSTCAFTTIMGVYSYTRRDSPAMVIIGLIWYVKNTYAIWGQDTPTVLCPGNPMMFCVAYIGISTAAWLLAGCPRNGDISFPYSDVVGLAIFVLGLIYSFAYEAGRFRWKKLPENKGKAHTVGLASLSVHPNYFGDLLTYNGWALAGGTRCAFSLSAFQMGLFLWFWIPQSDAYLAQRYPNDFPSYAAKTATIIPLVRSPFINQAIAWGGLAYSLYASTYCGMNCE